MHNFDYATLAALNCALYYGFEYDDISTLKNLEKPYDYFSAHIAIASCNSFQNSNKFR